MPTSPVPPSEGPGVERTITLTDAVVAIAMTLLVLPLVEISGEVDPAHLDAFFGQNWDLLLSFGVSFLVIYRFWSAHGTAYRRLQTTSAAVPHLHQLNLWWLLLVAFLPFPTAVIGKDVNTASAVLYLGTLFVLSALTGLIGVVIDRATGSARSRWAWFSTAVIAFCTLLSLVEARVGMLALLLLLGTRYVETRASRPS